MLDNAKLDTILVPFPSTEILVAVGSAAAKLEVCPEVSLNMLVVVQVLDAFAEMFFTYHHFYKFEHFTFVLLKPMKKYNKEELNEIHDE